jgi:hypothetical protein
MRKILIVITGMVMLLMACRRETPVIPPLPPDQTIPTLDFEFVSVGSTIKFVPFGDTLPNSGINKGYELQLSDTNERILTSSSGIVTSISPDTTAAGGSLITVKFRRNSIYSFIYGGVTNVVVQVNDSLSGGRILGKVSGSGIVDFQFIINNNETLCPQNYGSPGFVSAIQQAILLSNSFSHTDTILSPCRVQSLPK